MSAPRWQEPNLARNPFVNERPVRRLAITLWVLFLLVAGAGLWMSRSIRLETGTRVAELARLNAATLSDSDRAVRLEAELLNADLPAQNVRVEFLNRRLAERSFSWNELLETLTAAMPRGVRLVSLAPEGFTRERGRTQAQAQTAATTRVALRIVGEAEETEALLEFVDRLFAHPAFDKPNLSRESTKTDLKIQFDIVVDYLPRATALLTTAALATAGAADGADSAGPVAGSSAVPGSSGRGAAPAAQFPGAATGAPEGDAGPAAGAGKAIPGAAVAGRPMPGSRATSDAAGAAIREDRGVYSGNDEAAAEEARGRAAEAARGAASAGGAPRNGFPQAAGPGWNAGGTPGAGSGGGSTATPPPATGAGARGFPQSVMPTPLRPYASSTGGGR